MSAMITHDIYDGYCILTVAFSMQSYDDDSSLVIDILREELYDIKCEKDCKQKSADGLTGAILSLLDDGNYRGIKVLVDRVLDE